LWEEEKEKVDSSLSWPLSPVQLSL
jgi:hypothetical protein